VGDQFNFPFEKFQWKWPATDLWGIDPNTPPVPDSMTTPVRAMLALMVVFLASFIAMSNAGGGHHEADAMAMSFLGIVGAIIGSRLAWWLIMPGIAGESTWVKRPAIGAPAAFGASILTFPVWIGFRQLSPVMEASFVSLLLLEWDKRLSPFRKDRFSIGLLITAGILALILSGMFDASDPEITIAIVAGGSLAASLLSPWNPGRGGRPPIVTPPPRSTPMPPMPPSPDVQPPDAPQSGPPPIPPPPPPFAGDAPIRNKRRAAMPAMVLCAIMFAVLIPSLSGHSSLQPNILILIGGLITLTVFLTRNGGSMSSAYSTAPRQIPPDSAISLGGVASGFARFMMTLIGGILLAVALLLAIAVVSDLPGLLNVVNPDARLDLERNLGTENWQRLLGEIGSIASFVLACSATVLLTLARRSRGGLHMVRAIVGIMLLFISAVAIGKVLPDWQNFVPASTPGATADWYFRQVDMNRGMKALFVGAIGYTILIWPARRNFPRLPAANEGAGASPR
jgi:hypothetical protein